MSLFGSGFQNNRNAVNVNTTFQRFYSDENMLTVRGWNAQLSFVVAPAVGKNENGLTQYESELARQITTSITQKNCACLIEGIESVVIPAINGERENGSVTVITGSETSKKTITIGYDGNDAYLLIGTNLDANGKANTIIKHTFTKTLWLSGYNPSTGSYDSEKNCEGELMNLISIINNTKLMDCTVAHAIRYDKAMRPMPIPANANAGYSNDMNVPKYSAPSTTIGGSDMSDFLPFN